MTITVVPSNRDGCAYRVQLDGSWRSAASIRDLFGLLRRHVPDQAVQLDLDGRFIQWPCFAAAETGLASMPTELAERDHPLTRGKRAGRLARAREAYRG